MANLLKLRKLISPSKLARVWPDFLDVLNPPLFLCHRPNKVSPSIVTFLLLFLWPNLDNLLFVCSLAFQLH
jgi:hypothetical protein